MSKTLAICLGIIAVLLVLFFMRDTHTTQQQASMTVTESAGTPVPHSTGADFSDWREFTPPAGKFKVLLPGLPQHATDKFVDPTTNEPRKYETFVAVDEHESAFMISMITFPHAIDDKAVDEVLKSIVNEMLKRNKDNKIVSMKLGNFRYYKALDFSLANGDLVIEGKVIAHDDSLYVLSMISKNNNYSPQSLAYFVNSFVLIDTKTAPTATKSK